VRRYAQISCTNTDDAHDAMRETLWIISRRMIGKSEDPAAKL
jgi:hypothetical protein